MVCLCRERHCCLALAWRCSLDGIGSFLVKRNQLPSVSAKSFVMATRSRTSGGWFFLAEGVWQVGHELSKLGFSLPLGDASGDRFSP
jgi:hypothetical protein